MRKCQLSQFSELLLIACANFRGFVRDLLQCTDYESVKVFYFFYVSLMWLSLVIAHYKVSCTDHLPVLG